MFHWQPSDFYSDPDHSPDPGICNGIFTITGLRRRRPGIWMST